MIIAINGVGRCVATNRKDNEAYQATNRRQIGQRERKRETERQTGRQSGFYVVQSQLCTVYRAGKVSTSSCRLAYTRIVD